MPEFDIVIAHRGDELGLWATISSCEMDLERAGGDIPYDYRYYIVSNGSSEKDEPMEMHLERLGKKGVLGNFLSFENPMAPPTARNIGAARGQGSLIFFFDNHCLVEPGYFDRAFNTMRRNPNIAALHSVTKYWSGEDARYHYRFTLERNFWGYQVTEPFDLKPYRIAAGGHGGFVVRRKDWEEVGGYWGGFVGYGGEESYFELKLALMDKLNYLDPRLVHWHHPGKRPYERDKSDDFIKNMLCSANIIGGEKWAWRVLSGLKIGELRRPPENQRNLDRFFEEAMERSAAHAKWMESVRKCSLNEQLVKFARQGVAL